MRKRHKALESCTSWRMGGTDDRSRCILKYNHLTEPADEKESKGPGRLAGMGRLHRREKPADSFFMIHVPKP